MGLFNKNRQQLLVLIGTKPLAGSGKVGRGFVDLAGLDLFDPPIVS